VSTKTGGSRSKDRGTWSRGPLLADFAEDYLCHTKGPMIGTPLVFDAEQRAFWNEFHRVDARGNRVYRQGIKGVPRGNGKTPECAADGLFELMTRTDAPEIFNFAGSEDQGAELTEFARAFVDRGADGGPGALRRWLVAH
jgi:hypothetical protein